MQSEFGKKRSARRVSFVGNRYSIARSFAKDDDAYSLHRTGVDVCWNEPECVAFCVVEKFYAGVEPSRGDPVLNFFIILRKPSPVRAKCA